YEQASGPSVHFPYITNAEGQRRKAEVVLAQLGENQEFSGLRPVFVSIGGGDGEELCRLLLHSTANHGFLIEADSVGIELAIEKKKQLPSGKTFEICN